MTLAERRMGQLLIHMEQAGEIAGKGGDRKSEKIKVAHDDLDNPKTLTDLEITKDQSARYKALANAPDEAFKLGVFKVDAFNVELSRLQSVTAGTLMPARMKRLSPS